ncbi:MAG: exodeoxyribonuclease VII small subunit [Ruminococcaceae bacterium]|nr:exodeoxyribonuclease VII small subunit [Oscillospiraceae bacterium]
MSNEKNSALTFEEALLRLETLVRTLESGNEDLNSSLAAFEEGISLVRFCTEKLENAEQKVKILLSGEGGLREAPLEEQGGTEK